MTSLIEMIGIPFLVCVMMVLVLGYLGIHVLKREVIFIDIALAQIAVVGSVVAHLALGAHGDSPVAYGFAFGFIVLASLFFTFARHRVPQIPLEAIIGVCYALAAAAALFLVGTAPGGHIHVQEMLSGSLLWANWSDVIKSSVVFSLVGLCFVFLRKPMNRLSDSYRQSAAIRGRMLAWDFLFYVLLGLIITLAVRMAGVVVVFAFLIIPATITAIFFSGGFRQVLLAWLVGIAASLAGLLFSYYLDFSAGPSITVFLGLTLLLAYICSKIPGIKVAKMQ